MIDTVKELFGIFKDRWFAYNQTFGEQNKYAHYVLKDLARFCRANESTFHIDPRMHAVLEGRREVWLRIQEHLQFTPEQIYALHPVKDAKGSSVNLPQESSISVTAQRSLNV